MGKQTAYATSHYQVGPVARPRLVAEPADVLAWLEGQLWAAAQPDTITEARVVDYCEARGLLHPRLELAVLREANVVVEPARVIERVLADVQGYLQRGGGEISFLVDDSRRALRVVVKAALLNPSTPVFAAVERLLRLGWLTHNTRVTLLYWKRLRDYLTWAVTETES